MQICQLGAGTHDVIRKEAWLFCRTSSGVRLCWELEEPTGPQGRYPTRVLSRELGFTDYSQVGDL